MSVQKRVYLANLLRGTMRGQLTAKSRRGSDRSGVLLAVITDPRVMEAFPMFAPSSFASRAQTSDARLQRSRARCAGVRSFRQVREFGSSSEHELFDPSQEMRS